MGARGSQARQRVFLHVFLRVMRPRSAHPPRAGERFPPTPPPARPKPSQTRPSATSHAHPPKADTPQPAPTRSAPLARLKPVRRFGGGQSDVVPQGRRKAAEQLRAPSERHAEHRAWRLPRPAFRQGLSSAARYPAPAYTRGKPQNSKKHLLRCPMTPIKTSHR